MKKKSDIKDYAEFCATNDKLRSTRIILENLSILIDVNGFIDFNFPEYIKESIEKEVYENNFSENFYKPLKNKLALALACTEEDRNNHIDDTEISFINHFFGMDITRDDVSEMHGKYI